MPIVDRVAAVAAEDPDRPAVVTEERILTYGQLAEHSALLDLGVKGSGPDGRHWWL
ncbi:hypothetical protein [Arthrobacter roseus]|uniref:hypothetical protein n=1 Tax=Arthrobacter roseus TaxID=136274 RepID=UPI0019663A2E|nr:hypothetical protein [Arthrobacter roseus]MBM7848506.1 non-ribosomal peptide synthetase component E (peptide arylation enzyme) [Arthrobacter roseus]